MTTAAGPSSRRNPVVVVVVVVVALAVGAVMMLPSPAAAQVDTVTQQLIESEQGNPTAAAASEALADDDLVVVGSGWGHGIGLSQYGAYGMALAGQGYAAILRHYYQGTALGTMGSGGLGRPGRLWVNLEMGRSAMTLRVIRTGSSGGVPATVSRDGSSWNAPIGSRLVISGAPQCSMRIERPNGNVTAIPSGRCAFDIHWNGNDATPSTAIAVEGCTQAVYTSAGTRHDECRYARGELRVRPRSGTFDLSASMDMEQYLLGIAEMPYSWGTNAIAALRAQAVAARSYARELQITRGSPNVDINPGNGCVAWCHVRDTTFDQRYVGWGQEDPRWTQAVENTARRVVTHKAAPAGTIVRTYYSSSSPGRTENIHELWGTAPMPYLVSVPDPWSTRPEINPNASWTQRIDNASVARHVGLDRITGAVVATRLSTGSAATVAFSGPSGGQQTTVTRTASWMRTTFGLRSVHFSLTLPSAQPPSKPPSKPPSSPPVQRFTDVGGNVHATDIAYIDAWRITRGCNPPANTRYCPERPVTRGQMAAFLVRALDLPPASRDFFSDDSGSEFQDDINRLAASRITLGCNPPANTRFCPNQVVTRGQMAAFLVRALNLPPAGRDFFTDDNSSEFQGDINRLAASRITLGCNPPANTRFCPTSSVRRDQMASFLYRALTR